MSTRATLTLRGIADDWEDQYPSGVNAGIVGDTAHRLRGGYHISIEDQPATNYSVTRPKDKAPPGDWPRDAASAVDQSMNARDMALCFQRVHAVWADRTDPRRVFFNAFNGWDGKSAHPVRLDFVSNGSSTATDDHMTHTHGELCRCWADNAKAARAWLSMTGGQSKADWIKQEEAMTAVEADLVGGDDARLKATNERLRTTVAMLDKTPLIWTEGFDPKTPTYEPNNFVLAIKAIQAGVTELLARPSGDQPVDLDALAALVVAKLAENLAEQVTEKVLAGLRAHPLAPVG